MDARHEAGHDEVASPPSPHTHVERASAAVADMGLFETDDQRTKFREREPFRHLSTQYTALGFWPDAAALAGDNQHETQTIAIGALQEMQQRTMRARLRHAVQIESRIDFNPAA